MADDLSKTLAEHGELYRLHQAERMIEFARRQLGREPTIADLDRMSAAGEFAPIHGSDGKIES